MPRSNKKFDIHQEVTNRIVDAIESAGEFQLPWITNKGGSFARPVNIDTKNAYNGVNVLSLWISGQANDYQSNVWGTYRQWQKSDCQVRKGEKSAIVVFYKKFDVENQNTQTGQLETEERMFARASWVFNAAQVDGYEIETYERSEDEIFDPVVRAEAFATSTKADIDEGGDEACYMASTDVIQMPDRYRFTGTDTITPAEGFYSTLCHELVHWSGSKARLDRDLTGRFGSNSYAVEELVAELGAAFLCGDLGITLEPRIDHAQYIKHWLQILKEDNKAIFTAASKASQSANWLIAHEEAA